MIYRKGQKVLFKMGNYRFESVVMEYWPRDKVYRVEFRKALNDYSKEVKIPYPFTAKQDQLQALGGREDFVVRKAFNKPKKVV